MTDWAWDFSKTCPGKEPPTRSLSGDEVFNVDGRVFTANEAVAALDEAVRWREACRELEHANRDLKDRLARTAARLRSEADEIDRAANDR